MKRRREDGKPPNPLDNEEKYQNSTADDKNSVSIPNNPCRLLDLPVELLDLVFQHLDIESTFFLGLQSPHLWTIARRRIRLHVMTAHGQWAGSRIMCAGGYAEPTDVPPDTLTTTEKGELQQGLSFGKMSGEDDDDSTHVVPCPINVYNLARARYQEMEVDPLNFTISLVGRAVQLGEWRRLPDSFRQQVHDEMDQCSRRDLLYPEEGQTWILRNLTTREYVRPEAIALKPEYIHGPKIECFGFGEVVLSRISWSSCPSCGIADAPDLYRGVWAGHRFDITTLERHERGEKGVEWKNISEEVNEWVDYLWGMEFGNEWQEELQ